MSRRSAIRNKLDKTFSLLIRKRGQCERCGGTHLLQTSHHFSRSNLATRWDTDGACCLCASCHFWWHKNPIDAIRWLEAKVGKAKVDEISRKANSIKKWTDQELEALLEELQSKLG